MPRRQLFNALVLGNLIPWLILGVAPDLYALIMSQVQGTGPVSRAALAPRVPYLLYAMWTFALYLFSVFVGVGGCRPTDEKKKAPPLPTYLVMALVVAVVSPWTVNGKTLGPAILKIVLPYWPALAVLGLVLAAVFYRAGWQRFRGLDF